MRQTLPELIEAYRNGDAAAQEELLERLESQLRSIVRALLGKQIRTERDSLDICQSLMLALRLQVKAGTLNLDSEDAMRGYLRTMVRNKLANLAARIKTAKRGGGRPAVSAEELALPSFDPSASMVAGTAELRIKVERVLEKEELAILQGRLAGRTNVEIANELHKTPDGVRMTWNRAREKLLRHGILNQR